MRIVFNIDVGIDVQSYVQAGEVLDRITRNLDETIGPKGSYDLTNFRARHRAVHEFADQKMMSMPDITEAEQPRRVID